MIEQAIAKVVERKDLSEQETERVFESIMTGKSSPGQIASFITALRMKGETVDEITGAARVMRKKAIRINPGKGVEVIDTCGTGGSGKNLFNVSTAVAIILAACGVRVAKHGNRGISSKCGSADILEYLGVKIDIPPKKVEKCVKEINIGFLFAPLFHCAMKYASGPRKEIGIRTIFNLLGPLSNPAGALYQLIGVYDESLTEKVARVLWKLGLKKAYVVYGVDGLDEVTLETKTKVSELKNNKIRTFFIRPEDFGVKKVSLGSVTGGDVRKNAAMIKQVLSGKTGPARDIVLVNASLGLMAAGKAGGYKSGFKLVSEAIDSGRAKAKLEELIKITNHYG
jgi:anthranilate phosphoribosyltransferase